MSTRYENAPDWVLEMVEEVRAQHFEGLATAEILVIMDGQKRKSRGRYVLGDLKKASSMINFLSAEDYDYVLILDRHIFERLEDEDRRKLLYHLLCYGWKDTEDEEETFKLARPDYELFSRELVHNPTWKKWWLDMAGFAASCHEAIEPPAVNDPRCPNMFQDQGPDKEAA